MMRFPSFATVGVLLVLCASASADDQQKAEAQTKKIAAMATDKTGRRMVSMSMAETFKVPRADFVKERRDLGLDYGSLFIAHELLAGGMSMQELSSALQSGKSILQVANDRHANWKQIAGDTKKINTRIDEHIFRHFTSEKNIKADDAQDAADHYDTMFDSAAADSKATKEEIAAAQERYLVWRDRASPPTDKRLGIGDEKMVYTDHARNGPSGSMTGTPSTGTAQPPLGGTP